MEPSSDHTPATTAHRPLPDPADLERMRREVQARIKEEEAMAADVEKATRPKKKGGGNPSSANTDLKPYAFITDRGRIGINTAKLAKHLEKQFAPIYHEGGRAGDFYRYDPAKGFWRLLPESEVRQACATELGGMATASKTADAIQCLKDFT